MIPFSIIQISRTIRKKLEKVHGANIELILLNNEANELLHFLEHLIEMEGKNGSAGNP